MTTQIVNGRETPSHESARLRQAQMHVRVAKARKQHSRKTDRIRACGIRYRSDAVRTDAHCRGTVPLAQPIAIDGVVDAESRVGAGFRVGFRGHGRPISVRTANSSGKKVRSRAFCKKPTPLEPPVPRFVPIMRMTVFM